jgi:hypothetical protein
MCGRVPSGVLNAGELDKKNASALVLRLMK